MRLNYAAIRKRVSIRLVLELLAFKPTIQGYEQWRGRCPFCSTSDSPADANAPFSVHITRNLFQCFRCHRYGNSLDLWVQISGLPLYAATLDLCHRLAIPPITQNQQPPNSG
jgi:hypothetical protein